MKFLRQCLSIACCLLLSCVPLLLAAQQGEEPEETLITLQIPHIGNFEMPALMHKQQVYLPVIDLFEVLKIRIQPSEGLDSISGFFLDPRQTFLIDNKNHRIQFSEKTIELQQDQLLETESGLYLMSKYFGEVFGLECEFQFRNLSVVLTSAVELPIMREMRLEQLRKNLSALKGEKKADTTIGRSRQLFNIGTADWSFTTSQEQQRSPQTRFNMSLGGMFAGGETQASYNYNSSEPISMRQLYYRWRFVDNSNPVLKQASVGKFFPASISSLFSAMNGIHFTNMPTGYRKSFGNYRISNRTEPGWTVELYVNNVLVNYVKADASGFYTLEVPLVYGNSLVTLHFYGPWGEERTREENINIPFNFIPLHEVEYNVTAGILEDGDKSRFSRINLNYGLANSITVGGGMEYLSSIQKNKSIPFLTSAVRLGSRVLLSAEYAHLVRYKSVLSYSLPSSLQFELSYIKYKKEQQAIKFNYLEERKAMFSVPVKIRDVFTFSRVTLNQFVMPKMKITSAELLFSGVFSGISANLRNYYMINHGNTPYAYTNLSLSYRLPWRLRMIPQVQYDYSSKSVSMVRTELEKSLRSSKGFFNLSYENSFVSKTELFSLSFRYNFSFGQTIFSARSRNNSFSLLQSARGSMVYDRKSKLLSATPDYNTGRGGLVVVPFLDLNNNGRQDDQEPRVPGLNIRINGRHILRMSKDSSIQVLGLEAYSKYLVELDPTSFENISWQVRNRSVSMYIEPNLVKTLRVPVIVAGEVSGNVNMETDGGVKGAARILVCIYNSEGALVAKTLTEPDGYFYYLGLAPGSYQAAIDASQLSKLQLRSTNPIPFKILQSKEGDMVEDLEFTLSSDPRNSNPSPK